MEYQDFTLRFDAEEQDRFRTSILSSPAGQATDTFRLPLDLLDQRRILDVLTFTNIYSRNKQQYPRLNSENIGDCLYQALFSNKVGKLFERSSGSIEADSNHSLRIKICINPNASEVALVHSLPWELLYSKERREFLGLSRKSSIVRSLDVPRPLAKHTKPRPLNILVAISSPRGFPSIDYEAECHAITEAIKGTSSPKIEVIKGANLTNLRNTLLKGTFSILHIICHSQLSPAKNRTELLLEENRYTAPASGTMLARVLADCGEPPVVVLNACNTASCRTLNPFAGVTAELLVGGIPSVIAMQFPVRDIVSIQFSSAFYRSLSNGDSLDAAITEGRHGIYSLEPDSVEWASPVLFQRTSEPQTWQPPVRNTEGHPTAPPFKRRAHPLRLFRHRSTPTILLFASFLLWFFLRIGVTEPGKISTVILDDSSAQIPELEGINRYPISLGALGTLVETVAEHKPSVIGINVSLAKDETNEARAFVNSLMKSEVLVVLAQERVRDILPALSETCAHSLQFHCEEAAAELISGIGTLGGQLKPDRRLFFMALADKVPPRFAHQAILPINANSQVDNALTAIPAALLFDQGGRVALHQKPVILGGEFNASDTTHGRPASVVDRHFLFVPWGTEFSGFQLQALLAAYALNNGLLWEIDPRFAWVLLLALSLARKNRILVTSLYLSGVIAARFLWPLVLPLWPVWIASSSEIITRRKK